MTYATVAQFRSYNGIQSNELTETEVTEYLTQADKFIKRNVYVFVREEAITPDSNGYFFTKYRFLADGSMNNSMTVDDLEIKEYNSTYNILSAVNSSNVSTIDSYNAYFTMDSNYSANTNLYVNYWVCAKPFDETTQDDLKECCIYYATYLAFKYIKTKRLKGGIVSFSLGKLNINRNEKEYDDMVNSWKTRFDDKARYLRPLIVHSVAEGRNFGRDDAFSFLNQNGRHPNILRGF